MGFFFLMTFKIYFDKLEKNKKPITAKQFGFHAWTEPKDRVHEILPEGSQKEKTMNCAAVWVLCL
jgi:hypothetical protein